MIETEDVARRRVVREFSASRSSAHVDKSGLLHIASDSECLLSVSAYDDALGYLSLCTTPSTKVLVVSDDIPIARSDVDDASVDVKMTFGLSKFLVVHNALL